MIKAKNAIRKIIGKKLIRDKFSNNKISFKYPGHKPETQEPPEYIDNKIPINNKGEIWIVEFEGGYVIKVPHEEGMYRDKAMMKARDILSKNNRYNFEARSASGGRILKCYKQ